METEEFKRVENEFRAKLAALLTEYHVVITAEDTYRGWPECGEDIKITFEGQGLYKDGPFRLVFPFFNIELGSRVTPTDLIHEKT